MSNQNFLKIITTSPNERERTQNEQRKYILKFFNIYAPI